MNMKLIRKIRKYQIVIYTLFKERTNSSKVLKTCIILALGIFCILIFCENTRSCTLNSLLSPNKEFNTKQIFSICIIKSSLTSDPFDIYCTKDAIDISNFLTVISESVVSFDGNSDVISYNKNLYDITITFFDEETIDFVFSDLGEIYFANKRYSLENNSLQLFLLKISN